MTGPMTTATWCKRRNRDNWRCRRLRPPSCLIPCADWRRSNARQRWTRRWRSARHCARRLWRSPSSAINIWPRSAPKAAPARLGLIRQCRMRWRGKSNKPGNALFILVRSSRYVKMTITPHRSVRTRIDTGETVATAQMGPLRHAADRTHRTSAAKPTTPSGIHPPRVRPGGLRESPIPPATGRAACRQRRTPSARWSGSNPRHR